MRVRVVDPWERHAAQLRAWCVAYDAHDVAALVDEGTAEGFLHVDHRNVAGAGWRDRDGFRASVASSLELLGDLRAEAKLLVVDGNRRVARMTYISDEIEMTTFALGELDDEDRLARQDVYDDAADALEAMKVAAAARLR